uniref:FH2 domain-containing protein n=2 Tax=Bursaphelenchus xylophilus TaxID=6326 RepID=A0A1I7RMP4_BURXY
MLGIGEVIDRLRNQHGQALEDHLDLFEMMRHEDELELSHSSCASTSNESMDLSIEVDNPQIIAEHLQRKLDRTVAYPHFLSILQHMMLIPSDERNLHIWRLFDLILQQLSIKSTLETSNVSELDSTFDKSYDFEMDEVLTRLRTQHECERLEKELNDAKEELDQEKKKVMELENRLSDLQDGMSLSSFSRTSDLSSTSDPRQSPTPTISSIASLPPVNPPRLIPPPPPPPPPFGANPLAQTVKKKVPKPVSSVRTFNWTKLANDKIKNTVWENVNEEKLYDQLDLTDLCQQFAATKNEAESTSNTIHKRFFKPETVQTVIEPRRAQNCTIMLSKLKLSHKEIRNSLLSMDEKQKLPKDMIEQMLKYIPTKEELSAIQETLTKHKSPAVLPLADRFFYEVGQIQRYEQRLQCLHTMRTFQERVEELVPYLNAVSKASTTLTSSKRLKQFLALLLAIGNYLNFGKRMGNAMGFTIGSINQASNVRSSLKADRTLLHYIAEIVENKFPDLLRIKKELHCVYEATKFTKNEMDQEIKSLQTALCFVSAELRIHQQKLMDTKKQALLSNNNSEPEEKAPEFDPNEDQDHGHDSGVETGESPRRPSQRSKSDKFVSTVSGFLREANKALNALEAAHEDTKQKFADCARFFAEDPAKSSPDQFFGVFTRFLNQFGDSYAMVLKEREDQERVKKQTISRSLFSRKVNRGKRDEKNKDFERLIDALQTGELFSEDLSRLRMSVRHPKNKRPAQQPAIA